MLVFVDESGDTGLHLAKGSSDLFAVMLVMFEENDEAQAADDRITLLRRELRKSEAFEFYFKENSDAVRRAFLEAIVPYNFFYLSPVHLRHLVQEAEEAPWYLVSSEPSISLIGKPCLPLCPPQPFCSSSSKTIDSGTENDDQQRTLDAAQFAFFSNGIIRRREAS